MLSFVFLASCDNDPDKEPVVNQYRRNLADDFVNALTVNDRDLTIYDSNPLLDYPKKDFSEEAKYKLGQYLDKIASEKSYDNLTSSIILLVGVADVQSAMNPLQAIVDQVEGPLKPFKLSASQLHEIAFAALKARARMGDEKAIEECIRLVDSEEDEDFKVGILLRHISYIRQPEAISYIKRYLYSDKKERSAGPDVIVRSYTRIAAKYLQEMVAGFPTEKETFDFYLKTAGTDLKFRKQWPSFDDYYIYCCRQWLEKQPSVEIIR
jgi:hypothetical protein